MWIAQSVSLLSACLMLWLCGALAWANQARVLLVMDPESEIHQAVLDGLRANPASIDWRLEIANQHQWLDRQEGRVPGLDDYPLILTIGTRAAQLVLQAAPAAPVLSVLVPKTTYEQLLGAAPAAGQVVERSAIYLDQPPRRQLALARALLPQARTAGLIVGPGLGAQADGLTAMADTYTLELRLTELGHEDDPARAIQRMLPGSDLVLALYDPVVLKPLTAKWLLYMAYQRRTPVIAFSQGYLKAGAVAAVFSTPQQIGRQAGELLNRWLRDGGDGLGDPRFPQDFEIGFNRAVAESLDLRFPGVEEARERMALLLEITP